MAGGHSTSHCIQYVLVKLGVRMVGAVRGFEDFHMRLQQFGTVVVHVDFGGYEMSVPSRVWFGSYPHAVSRLRRVNARSERVESVDDV